MLGQFPTPTANFTLKFFCVCTIIISEYNFTLLIAGGLDSYREARRGAERTTHPVPS